MQYTPEYDEIVTKGRAIADTVEWLRKTADRMAAEGLMNYSLSLITWADRLESVI